MDFSKIKAVKHQAQNPFYNKSNFIKGTQSEPGCRLRRCLQEMLFISIAGRGEASELRLLRSRSTGMDEM